MRINPYFAVLLATFIFGTSGAFIKYLQLPASVLAFFRMAIPTAVLYIYFAVKGEFLVKKSSKIIVLASALNAIRVFFYVFSFAYTSIANAVIILYTWPVFATLFSALILKEKIAKSNAFLLILPFLGVILLFVQQDFSLENRDMIGMVSMLFSAAMFAFTLILFKIESHKYSGFQTVFYQNMVGGLFFLPFFFVSDYSMSLNQIFIAILFAVLLGILAYGLFFSALRRMKASTLSMLAYLEVVFAIFFGYFLFQEAITWNMLLGGSLIIISAILLKKE